MRKERLQKGNPQKITIVIANMKIKVKLLKPFSDKIGKRDLEIDFKGKTVKDLLNLLVERYKLEFYKAGGELEDGVCIVINDKPSEDEAVLNNGDKVLIFLAVSGG